MQILLSSTGRIVDVDGTQCRVWDGLTVAGGVRCYALVHRLAVAYDDDCTQFEAELQEIRQPVSIVDPTEELLAAMFSMATQTADVRKHFDEAVLTEVASLLAGGG